MHSLRTRALLVTPIRLTLGALALVGALIAGSRPGPALIAFVLGALGIAFVIFNDPRARFVQRDVQPLPLPQDAVFAPPWRQALAASLPSTVGVTVLAVVALFFRPTLGALLGGVCAGLGIASLITLVGLDPRLALDPKSSVVYRR